MNDLAEQKIIVLCDAICHGCEHVPINASMVHVVASAFPCHHIVFAAESSHVAFVQEAVSADLHDRITFRRVAVAARRIRGAERVRKTLAVVDAVIDAAKPRCLDQVVLLATCDESLRPLKIQFSRRVPGTAIVHVVHGGAVKLRHRSRNPLTWRRDARSAFRATCVTPWMHLFLEFAVRNEAVKVIPQLARFSDVVEHPLPPDASLCHVPFRKPIDVAFLGGCSRAKGFHRFLDAAQFAHTNQPGEFRFHAIGALPENEGDPRIGLLATKPRFAKLDRAEFVEKLAKVHYVFLPYSSQRYNGSPSGVLLDAIGFGKPVVCTDVPLFSSLFRQHGDMGIMAAETDHWGEHAVHRLSRETADSYENRCEAIDGAKRARTITLLAERYRKALSFGSSTRVPIQRSSVS